MLRFITLLFCSLMFVGESMGQNTWVKTPLEEKGPNHGNSIVKDHSGNIVCTGYTSSLNDKGGGSWDIFVLKLDSIGNILWKNVIGGSESEEGSSITVTTDNDYILTGYTYSNDGDFKNEKDSSKNIVLLKFDKEGQLKWKKILGGNGKDCGISVISTVKGNIYLLVTTDSEDGDFSKNKKEFGNTHIIMKLDFNGNIVWKKNFDNQEYENGLNIKSSGLTVLSDESIVITGSVQSSEFMDDIFVKRYSSNGVLIWEKVFSGDVEDYGYSITSDINDDIFITGSTRSLGKFFKGMNIKHKKYDEWGISSDTDVFLIKLDSNGKIIFKNTFGGSEWDDGYGVKCTSDGSVIVTGRTRSNDGIFKKSNIGGYDIFIIKVDSKGKLIWKNVIGGTEGEWSDSIDVFDDSSIILTGWTNSSNGIFGNRKGTFIIKLDNNGKIISK